MFMVPPAVRLQRLDICKGCKFYVPATKSCGTLILGGKAEEEVNPQKASHYRKKIKLCGCVMPWKTKYALASCPAGKWARHALDDTQVELLREFVLSLQGKSKIDHETVQKLYRWKQRLSGKHEPISNCPPCVKELIDELTKEVNRLDKLNP